VFRYCLSLLRDAGRAEDLAGDVFVSAFLAFDKRPEDPERMVAWLFTIARHAAIDDSRRRVRWGRIAEYLRRQSKNTEDDDPNLAIENRARAREVIEAIAQLKRRDRELLALRLGAELSHAEMSAVLGMSEHAVAMATRRAMARLRERLGKGAT
jgi:RNA polymerase sigma-70 factor (ECF subfamily)